MEENKTGVWVRCTNNKEIRYNHDCHSSFDVGDIVEVENDDVYAKFKIEVVELKGVSTVLATYTIKPQLRIDRISPFCSTITFHDAEPIEMDVYANDEALIIVPFWYEKEQYRNQSIRSTESVIAITRKESLKTTNEDLEIKAGTISADKIKVDTSTLPPLSERRVPAPSYYPYYQQKPITATSEAEKNWFGGFSAPGKSRIMHDDRGIRSQIQTFDDWNGEMSATLTFLQEKIDEIMNKLAETKKEKDMYIKNLKEMIKKPIYVDKEITVKEPMLDNNGKQIEKDGKPVFKIKHYHGMVKILWTSGEETVAYVEGNDVYDRENGFKTCVLKYLCGNAGAHDAVDFWTNKYVKYPSSCIEVTENLCKLGKILEKDKRREEERKGLLHAKFLRRTKRFMTFDSIPDRKDEFYTEEDEKHIKEFKKLAKKYFPELKGKEIYVNGNKNDEVFVAIK